MSITLNVVSEIQSKVNLFVRYSIRVSSSGHSIITTTIGDSGLSLAAFLVKEPTHRLHHSSTPPTTKELVAFTLPALSLPLKPAISPPLDAHICMPAAHSTGHAYSLTYQTDAAQAAAAHGPRPQSKHPLQARRQAQAEAGKERGQEASSDEGQYDEREDLEWVAFGIVDQVAEQALELLVRPIQKVRPRRAPVVRG